MLSFKRRVMGVLISLGVFGAIVHADQVTFRGVVENQAGQPIRGATVTLTTMGGGQPASATTDSTGAYIITRQIMGAGGVTTVILSAAATGYVTAVETVLLDSLNDGIPDTVVQDFTLRAGGPGVGDSLYVTGTVRNPDSQGIGGATVTVSILSMTETQTSSATTNSAGAYTVAMLNQNAGRSVTITVTANGYQQGQAQVQIADPSDGTPDRITRNFVLVPIVYDTLVVTGRVIDSLSNSALSGARLIISTLGGAGQQTVLDTLLSDANGSFGGRILVQTMPPIILWRAEMGGYVSKTGQRVVVNDTAVVGTVALVPFSQTDSVSYTVRGMVSDSATGLPIRNTDVVVHIMFGTSELVLLDTVRTNFEGRYMATSPRVAYQAGNNTVTVSVSAAGYVPASKTVTVPTSTTTITVDMALVRPTAAVRNGSVIHSTADRPVVCYDLGGRRMVPGAARSIRGMQLVLRRADGPGEKVIPAR